jgi:hypothetical protein
MTGDPWIGMAVHELPVVVFPAVEASHAKGKSAEVGPTPHPRDEALNLDRIRQLSSDHLREWLERSWRTQ